MKRLNLLFDQIIDYQNIRLAFLKAVRGNRSSLAVINFCRNTDYNLAAVREKLRALNPQWGGYRSFLITDPKLRVISTAPFEQRIMHHALMNVLEPVFNRPMIHHSYACRKGKGTHAAVLYAFKQCKSNPCFLKLDVRKYFDSIDHATLKIQLRRLIKDMRVITLLDGIIDGYETTPGKGVPIGNLTSQFFANMFLAGLDHYILEQLHHGVLSFTDAGIKRKRQNARAYCRYMDDFIVWASSMAELKTMFERINHYASENLHLTLKPPVFGKCAAGLPFLGFLIKDSGIYLMQKSKRRYKERMAEITVSLRRGEITEEKAAQRARSVCAAIALARTNRLRYLVCKKGERFLAPTA